MYSTTPGYYQSSFPPHYGQGVRQNGGPPPAKKTKGNPIITRYPPPPGYKGPAPLQQLFQQPPWQPPTQGYGYGHGQSIPPGFQPPTYGLPHQFQPPQPQYPGYSPQPHPGYGESLSQAPCFPPVQPGWQPMLTSPQSAPPAPWQVPANAFNQKQRRHNSAPFPAPGSTPRGSLDGSSIPFSPEGPASVAGSDLEEDFDSPCYFATYPDEINPDLSIGLIEWKAALPTKRALPSTFAEAELEALAPRKPHASDDESISEYFINDRREEAFLSVRQTDGWWDVKDDLIFREFSAVCAEVITIAELLFRYRERFDPHWATMGRESETPELSRETTPAQYDHRDTSVDSRMDVDGGYDHRTGQSGALDSLEKALLANPNERANGSAKHSRSTSVVSQNSTNVKKPKPLPLFRDQTQEEMLAALGVTGSPKMVYETPGPAFGPLPPDFASTNNRLAKTTNRANGAFPGGTNSQLPTPISNVSKRSPSFDPWKSSQPGNEHKAERPNSSCSQRTATGSDFYPEDNDSTPRPKFTRHDSRKRGLVDSEDEAYAPDDDATPKQRRKHPRVEAAYSRRW